MLPRPGWTLARRSGSDWDCDRRTGQHVLYAWAGTITVFDQLDAGPALADFLAVIRNRPLPQERKDGTSGFAIILIAATISPMIQIAMETTVSISSFRLGRRFICRVKRSAIRLAERATSQVPSVS